MSGWTYTCPCGWSTSDGPLEALAEVATRVLAHRQWHRDDLAAILAGAHPGRRAR